MANPLNLNLFNQPTPIQNQAPAQHTNWVVLATQPTFTEMKSGSQPLTLSAPSNHASNIAEGAVTPRRAAPIKALEPSSWVEFSYGKLVYAPNPRQNNQLCVGKMTAIDRNMEFAPLDSPDEFVRYMKIDFEYKNSECSGSEPAAIYRGYIWPV